VLQNQNAVQVLTDLLVQDEKRKVATLDAKTVENCLVCIFNLTLRPDYVATLTNVNDLIEYCVKSLSSTSMVIVDRAGAIIQNLAQNGTKK